MYLVYIIWPYRASIREGVIENIEWAKKRALEVYNRLYPEAYPVVPHLMGLWDPDALEPDCKNQEQHLTGLIQTMLRCDVAYLPSMDPKKLISSGQQDELWRAHRAGMPCFDNIEALVWWVKARIYKKTNPRPLARPGATKRRSACTPQIAI